jgi:hypothetical protein
MTDRADRVADSTIRNPLFIVFVLVILLVGVAIVPVVQLRDVTHKLQQETTDRVTLAKQNQVILKEIKSCTTPQGACARRGTDNSKNISVAITYCTLNLPAKATRDQVTRCILKELETKS